MYNILSTKMPARAKRMASISSLFIGLSITLFTNVPNYYLARGGFILIYNIYN